MFITSRSVFTVLISFLVTIPALFAQANDKKVIDLYQDIESYEATHRTDLLSKGTKYTASVRQDILSDRKALAKKYAAEIAARPNLTGQDLYLLGRLFIVAENDQKTLETMKRVVAEFQPDATGDLIQSALGYVITLSSKTKQMEAAEAAYSRWLKSAPPHSIQQPAFEDYIATGYYKDGKYDQAISHAQSAFDELKAFPTRSIQEKRDREQIYMNLVEILALGYKKAKNADRSLNILAEARAESFALPSAGLYRKVMDFVEGSGFSEKKLMQKVDSFPNADAAPDIKVTDWIGRDPIGLSELRGKVVLLDFWATWCGPCISTFPRLRDWHKKYAGSDFVLIGVTEYEGEKDGKRMSQIQEMDYLKEFKEKYKLPYPIAISGRSEASAKFGINAFPTTILLDRNGVVRYIGIGSGAEESGNLEDTIKKVLKEEVKVGEFKSPGN